MRVSRETRLSNRRHQFRQSHSVSTCHGRTVNVCMCVWERVCVRVYATVCLHCTPIHARTGTVAYVLWCIHKIIVQTCDNPEHSEPACSNYESGDSWWKHHLLWTVGVRVRILRGKGRAFLVTQVCYRSCYPWLWPPWFTASYLVPPGMRVTLPLMVTLSFIISSIHTVTCRVTEDFRHRPNDLFFSEWVRQCLAVPRTFWGERQGITLSFYYEKNNNIESLLQTHVLQPTFDRRLIAQIHAFDIFRILQGTEYYEITTSNVYSSYRVAMI